MVLTVPDMGDRYFSFQPTDPYTNVVDYIGSRTTGSQGGAYAITRDGGPQVAVPGAETVVVPDRNILMLGRTLAGNAAAQLATLARIGVGPGLRVADAGLGPVSRFAADLAVKATAALLPMPAGLTQLGSALPHHGRATPDPAIGNFGTDYLLRAGVAEVGLIANTPRRRCTRRRCSTPAWCRWTAGTPMSCTSRPARNRPPARSGR